MKLYDTKRSKILYALNPDLYFMLEDDYMELLEVLSTNELNGHNRFDQWMMKLAIKMQELLDTMSELDDDEEEEEDNTLTAEDKEELL